MPGMRSWGWGRGANKQTNKQTNCEQQQNRVYPMAYFQKWKQQAGNEIKANSI
jgi:hypothetical protein